MNCAYKFRIYPNKEQEKQIAQSFGCARFIFNRIRRFGYDNYYSVFDGRTDKYIVEYNIENSKKTMTTQEIIDTIYNKKHFEDIKGKTSKVVIYVKGRENIKLIKQILKMNDNTNFIKEKKQKEKEQEENDKFLEKTHVINDKE